MSKSYAFFVNQLSIISISSNVQDALTYPKKTKVMNEKIEALLRNNTWELCTLSKRKKIVGCRWMFTVKIKADASIDRFKKILIAKGDTQKYEVDYHKTFAPHAKINIICILISLAVNRD